VSKRYFNSLLKKCTTRDLLDTRKLVKLSREDREFMAYKIVRHRGPLLVELAALLDRRWLESMGYIYKTRSKKYPQFVFRHTCEHVIQ